MSELAYYQFKGYISSSLSWYNTLRFAAAVLSQECIQQVSEETLLRDTSETLTVDHLVINI